MPDMQIDYTRICPACGNTANGIGFVAWHDCPAAPHCSTRFGPAYPSLVFSWGGVEKREAQKRTRKPKK